MKISLDGGLDYNSKSDERLELKQMTLVLISEQVFGKRITIEQLEFLGTEIMEEVLNIETRKDSDEAQRWTTIYSKLQSYNLEGIDIVEELLNRMMITEYSFYNFYREEGPFDFLEITNDELLKIAKQYPNIQKLSFKSCCIKERSIDLTMFKHLEEVDFSDSNLECLPILIEKCKKLKTINLRDTDAYFRDETIKALINKGCKVVIDSEKILELSDKLNKKEQRLLVASNLSLTEDQLYKLLKTTSIKKLRRDHKLTDREVLGRWLLFLSSIIISGHYYNYGPTNISLMIGAIVIILESLMASMSEKDKYLQLLNHYHESSQKLKKIRSKTIEEVINTIENEDETRLKIEGPQYKKERDILFNENEKEENK